MPFGLDRHDVCSVAMLAADLIEPVARMRKGPNRPALLYRLKKAKSPVYFARTFNAPG